MTSRWSSADAPAWTVPPALREAARPLTRPALGSGGATVRIELAIERVTPTPVPAFRSVPTTFYASAVSVPGLSTSNR